jgi:FkbM family methyltransferase
MWGGVAGLLPPLAPKIGALAASALNPFDLWIDQQFLAEHVWPYIRDAAFVHDRFFQFGGPPLDEIDVALGAGSKVPLQWGYCRHGVMVWPKHDQFVGASLREYGEWSQDEVALLGAWLARGDSVVEGGANLGAHTMALARAVGPQGKVLAFEPQAEVARLLKYNADINGLANVDVRVCALGAESGQVSVPVPDYSVMQNFGGFTTGAGPASVEVASLDDLLLERLDLLKLDVISRFRPVLYVENDRRDLAEALIAFISQKGYRLWWHTPFLYSPDNWRKQGKDLFSKVLSVNMLCLPSERSPGSLPHLEAVAGKSAAWPSWVSQ